MPDNYHFVTHWRVKAHVDEVFDIIGQPLEYPRWWPSVYLDCRELAAGGIHGNGRRVLFETKGLLPYTLHWEARTAETEFPNRIVIDAAGDFNGRGEWTFAQHGDYTNIAFDWNITVSKPLIRRLTPVLRPLFEANHRWAMEQGESGLRAELIRYRAHTPIDLLEAEDPRGPVEVPVRWIAAGAVAVSALACVALVRRKSRRIHAAV